MSARAPGPRRIALVGNAPIGGDAAAAIDACERVVRCNGARGFGGPAGSRLDDLFLVNRGGAPAEWLEDPDLAERPAVAAASRVVLPLHPGSAYLPTRRGADGRVHRDDRDHTDALRERLGSPTRAVIGLPARHHERCCAALGLDPAGGVDDGRPSTGFVALAWYLDALAPGWRVVLHGFTFEGWEGHPWRCEREWVEARVREGTVRVVPARAAQPA